MHPCDAVGCILQSGSATLYRNINSGIFQPHSTSSPVPSPPPPDYGPIDQSDQTSLLPVHGFQIFLAKTWLAYPLQRQSHDRKTFIMVAINLPTLGWAEGVAQLIDQYRRAQGSYACWQQLLRYHRAPAQSDKGNGATTTRTAASHRPGSPPECNVGVEGRSSDWTLSMLLVDTMWYREGLLHARHAVTSPPSPHAEHCPEAGRSILTWRFP
jgi:hypothetical protein